jgi:DNA repair protein RecO
MEPKRDLAIVLRSVPYEERHRVVTALTERHGKLSALARNSVQSRRFGGALEPFAAAEWRFVERPGAELVRVDEAVIRRAYEGLRKDFERLSLASVFNELMLRLAPEREACPDLFRLHCNALAVLEELPRADGPAAYLPLLNGYLSKILQWNGNQPQLLQCLGCGAALSSQDPGQPVSCVVADAGWVCPSCRQQGVSRLRAAEARATADSGFKNSFLCLSPLGIVDFHVYQSNPIRQAPALCKGSLAEQKELFAFLEALLVYHVQGFDRVPLKGLRFLELESSLRSP